MATTPKGVPYPTPADANDVPADLEALATWVDDAPGLSAMTAAQRDALDGDARWVGRTIWNVTAGRIETWNGSGWAAAAAATHGHTAAEVGAAPSSHNHGAGDITSGSLLVARGGTGRSSVTSGNYLRGNGTGALVERTPVDVRSDIGAAAANHSHSATGLYVGAAGSSIRDFEVGFTPRMVTIQTTDNRAGTTDQILTHITGPDLRAYVFRADGTVATTNTLTIIPGGFRISSFMNTEGHNYRWVALA